MGSSSSKVEPKLEEPKKKDITEQNKVTNIYINIGQSSNFPSNNSTISNSNMINMNDNIEGEAPPAPGQANVYDNKGNQLSGQFNIVIENNKDGNKIIVNNSNKEIRKNLSINTNDKTNKDNNDDNQDTIYNTRNIDNNCTDNKFNKPDYKLENGNKEVPNFERNNRMNKNENKETEENKKTKGDVNINFGGKDREYKEYNKNQETKMGNIDPNVGGYMKEYGGENWNTFTKTGNESNNPVINDKNDEIQKTFTNTGNNVDNNISTSKIKKESESKNVDNNQVSWESLRKKDFEENDLSLSQSIISSSHLNIDLNDPNALLKLKEEAGKKIQDGYFPFFIKFNQKPEFYFIKEHLTLKDFLKTYYIRKEIKYNGENVKLYNGNRLLDLNTPFIYLDIKIFSVIKFNP